MKRNPWDSMMDAREDDVRAFGKHWIGPARFETWKLTPVALFKKDPPNGDGQVVHVYCQASPARCYTLRAEPSPNSVGEPNQGFALSTGSGPEMRDLVIQIAKAVSQGMLGLETRKPDAT